MIHRNLLTACLTRIAASSVALCAPVLAADAPSYEELSAHIQEKGVAESIEPNEYYDSTKEPENHSSVKKEVYRELQFPSRCVMEIVSYHFEEVAPPTGSGLVTRSGNKVTLSEPVRRAGKAFGRRRTAVGRAPPSEREQRRQLGAQAHPSASPSAPTRLRCPSPTHRYPSGCPGAPSSRRLGVRAHSGSERHLISRTGH